MKSIWVIFILLSSHLSHAQIQQFARFEHQGKISYGEIKGKQIQVIEGDLFHSPTLSGKTLPLSEVTLLLPTDSPTVFAVGMNFASHLSSASTAPPPLFLKLPTSLIVSGADIHLPKGANNVHFEGELVLVIGTQVKAISEAQAASAIFAVTVGNDLTERTWQASDLQWMRAKASDGFGPINPIMTRGVDYNNVLLTTQLNGKIVQQENTRNMIHKPAKVVSYLSHYFTLHPGDLIFMGTPGRTQSLTEGDNVSVTIDQVGTVFNTIRSHRL